MNAAIGIQESRGKRRCAYCGGDIPRAARFLRLSLSLWNKNGSSTGGMNVCGKCLAELALELGTHSPAAFLTARPELTTTGENQSWKC